MRKFINLTAGAFCGLLLLATAAFSQTGPGKSGSIVFPEVDGWEKGELYRYSPAELGYSVPYQSETAGSVTVYVYNGGLKTIADGIDDKNVKAQLRQAEDDIKSYGEAGYYEKVKFVKSDTVTLGGNKGTVKALYTLFNFKIRGAEVDSEIYLFGHKNNFIKVRATRPKGKDGADNAEVEKLLLEIGKAFTQ